MVQWLRIHLAMQGTWVPSLVGELKSHTPWSNLARAPQLPSTGTLERVHARRQKIPRDAAEEKDIRIKKKEIVPTAKRSLRLREAGHLFLGLSDKACTLLWPQPTLSLS